jgi:CDP-paratose 2-epimerase
VLITGGAGFVGTNLADRLLSVGQSVLIFDNLSRPGVEQNMRWLCTRNGSRVQVQVADVRNPYTLREAVQHAAQVLHLAAQVAVTSSRLDPMEDFEVNVQGPLSLLEALRQQLQPLPLVFTSTNKVYGELEDVALRHNTRRYEPTSRTIRLAGISEERPLDFHSPYGCSKGAADQYVIDYARMYGLPAVVFRMSCIYGPHQFGTEDQGWVAHFLIRTLTHEPIILYGDGMQVRDVLFVRDLIDALLLAQRHIGRLAGKTFNIGRGRANATSLLEVVDLIRELHGTKPSVQFAAWRPGDQKYYVSDIRRFTHATGWTPQVGLRQGIAELYAWLCQTRGLASGKCVAAVFVGPQRLSVTSVAPPEPGPHEVRVRLEGCGVCTSNLPVWEGRPWFTYPLAPGAPGHEGWGRIDAVGSEVRCD